MTLSYVLRGVTLALAWFLVVNALASVAVAAAISSGARDVRSQSPGFWFIARILPSALATIFVAALFVPSYLAYEPREFVEGFDLTLMALALCAVALWVTAGVRGFFGWQSAARRTAAWTTGARPLALAGTRLRAFEVDADAPVMALVGILRPRLLITRGLIDALTEEELAASVSHEIGHSHSWDNLKRLAMRAAPDLLGATAAARVLERRWAAAAERRADYHAAGADTATRCALASALVKVARLIPATTISRDAWSEGGEPISTLVGGGDIAARVEGLLDDSAAPTSPRCVHWTAIVAMGILVLAAYAPLLRVVHTATELLVQSLP